MDYRRVDVPDSLQRFSVKVAESRLEAEDIRSFRLIDPAGGLLPEFTAGAHVNVFMPSGRSRQYSIASDPTERRSYIIAVQREAKGRGGSVEMHDIASTGSHIEISKPINNFSISNAATRHLLIAGGIGITPILAMVKTLERRGKPWKLYYCARTPAKSAFCDALAGDTCLLLWSSRTNGGGSCGWRILAGGTAALRVLRCAPSRVGCRGGDEQYGLRDRDRQLGASP
jgi:ferredoxin-NADP reductase